MPTITETVEINASNDTIFRALATPSGIAGWWAKDGDCTDKVGGAHELRFIKEGRTVVMSFTVDALDADRVAWTCTANGNPVWPGTTLEWRIGDGTVVFTHDGFAEDQSPPFQMTADGWKHFMASLKAYAETGEGMPW